MAGFLYGPIGPLQNYAMQTRTPEDMRGRAFGVLTSAAYAAPDPSATCWSVRWSRASACARRSSCSAAAWSW